MSVVSRGERQYVRECLDNGLRQDNRGCEEYRTVRLEVGNIPQATGSARVQLGGTDVMVGVKVRRQQGPGNGLLSLRLRFAMIRAFSATTYCGLRDSVPRISMIQPDKLCLQVELGTPDPLFPGCGRMEFLVDFSPCGSPDFEVLGMVEIWLLEDGVCRRCVHRNWGDARVWFA